MFYRMERNWVSIIIRNFVLQLVLRDWNIEIAAAFSHTLNILTKFRRSIYEWRFIHEL